MKGVNLGGNSGGRGVWALKCSLLKNQSEPLELAWSLGGQVP